MEDGSSKSQTTEQRQRYDESDDVDSEYRRQEEAEKRARRGENPEGNQYKQQRSSSNDQDFGSFHKNDGKLDLGVFANLDPLTKNIIGAGLLLLIVGVFVWGFIVIKSYDKPKKDKKKKDK